MGKMILTDWVTVALSGGSLCAGAGLTMLGQYLSDRRIWVRDREARREDFRVKNFEIQRDALLELQEVIIALTSSVRSSVTVTQFSEVFGYGEITQWHEMREYLNEAGVKIAESRVLMEEARSPDVPVTRKEEIAAQFESLSAEFTAAAEQVKPIMERYNELAGLTNRVRILSTRTGDRDAIERCDNIRNALDEWSNAQDSQESEQRGNAIYEIAEHALTAIGTALRNGPLAS